MQNNYIDYLRDSTILKQQNELNPVLNMSDYTKFKNYTLVNSIPNTKIRFSELLLNNNKDIYGMERKTENCANFPLCNNTNARVNRKLNSIQLPTPTFRMDKNPVKKELRNSCYCYYDKIKHEEIKREEIKRKKNLG